MRIAAQPADAEHPYGHGKAEPLAAAVIAILIFIAALGISVQAVGELLIPHRPPAAFTLAVLVMVVFVKEALARYLFRMGDRLSSLVLRGDAWHQRSDAITSAVAMVGIAVAVVGGEKYQIADECAAIAASVVIAAGGFRVLRSAVDELMDHAPAGDLRQRAIDVARAQDQVQAVEKNWLRKVGPQYFLDVHIEVDPALTVDAAHRIAHRVSDAVRAAFPEIAIVFVHVEPHHASSR